MCKLDGLEVASGCGKCVDWGKRKGCAVQKPRASFALLPLCLGHWADQGHVTFKEFLGNSPLGSDSNSWWNKVERGWGSGWSGRNTSQGQETAWLPVTSGALLYSSTEFKMSEVTDCQACWVQSSGNCWAQSRGRVNGFIFIFVFQRCHYKGSDFIAFILLGLSEFSSFRRFPIIWGNSKHYFFLFYFSF